MGQGTSQRTKGAQSVEERLETMVQHIGDSAIVHGMLQEVSGIIAKNPAEREKFCDLLMRASTEQEALGLPANWMPFTELFSKVRFMQDGSSRGSVITWLRYLSEAHEARTVAILLRSDISSFISDFYSFQANTHVAPETLLLMSQLVLKWSLYDEFMQLLDCHDTFRILLPRLRFSRVGSDERSNLLQAMSRCYNSGLCRTETMELLLKISLDRDELSDTILCASLSMIANALRTKPELSRQLTQKQVSTLCRHLTGSADVVGAATGLLANLHGAVADSLFGVESADERAASEAVLTNVLESLEQLFQSDFLDVSTMTPDTLLNARLVTLHNKPNVLDFINPSSTAFTTLVFRSYEAIGNTSVAQGLFRVINRALSFFPECAAEVIRTPLVIDSFMDIVVAAPPTVLRQAVEVFCTLCSFGTASCLSICESRQFQRALRRVSVSLEREPQHEERSFAVMHVMKALLVPQVVSQADGLLLLTMYSIVCQILAASQVSSVFAPVNGPATTTIELALDLLLQRCRLGPSFTESVLGMLPMVVLRQVLAATHLSEAHRLAHLLIKAMMYSFPQARLELRMFGCIASSSALNGKRTLRVVQLHFRMTRYVRKVSSVRSAISNLTKDSFLQILEIADDEREIRTEICSQRDQTMLLLQVQANERLDVEKTHERAVSSLVRSEIKARLLLEQKYGEQEEQGYRSGIVKEEAHQRHGLPDLNKLIMEEITARSRIWDGDYAVQKEILFSRITRFLQQGLEHSAAMQALLNSEVLSRRANEKVFHDGLARLRLYDSVVQLSHAERSVREALDETRTAEHAVMAREMFATMLDQTTKEAVQVRAALVAAEAAWRADAVVEWATLLLEIREDTGRVAIAQTAALTAAMIVRHFVLVASATVARDEQWARAALSRTLLQQWKGVAFVPQQLLTAMAEEERGRAQTLRQERLAFNMHLEALRHTLPMVCVMDELLARVALDQEYAACCTDAMWRLAELRLYFDELGARNAVALQFYFTARAILTPFVCIRLLDYQRRLLQRDRKLRIALWIDEKAEFFELLNQQLKGLQRLERKAITQELRIDEERLAHHFLSVTHVVKLQEAAQDMLSKRLPPRRPKNNPVDSVH